MTDCAIIHDLIPLYHDKACSHASRDLVDDHVASCASCRAALAALEEPAVFAAPVNSFLPPPSRMKQARNRLVRKTALAATAIFCAVAVFVAGGTLLYTQFERERVIPCGSSVVTDIDGKIRMDFGLERYVRASCLFRRLNIGGKERDVAILQLTQSGARQFFDTTVGGPEEVVIGAGTQLYIGRGGQKHDAAYGPEYKPAYWDPRWVYPGRLTAVYYLESPSPADLRDSSAQDVLRALEQHGQVLWQR